MIKLKNKSVFWGGYKNTIIPKMLREVFDATNQGQGPGGGGGGGAYSGLTIPTPPAQNTQTTYTPPTVTPGNIPLTVNFTNRSTGDDLTYLWDFGHGNSDLVASATNSGYLLNNIELSPGDVQVYLSVVPASGYFKVGDIIRVGTEQMRISVMNSPTSSNFTVTRGVNGTTIGTWYKHETIWMITFLPPPNGNTSTLKNPTHIYNTAGTYTVKLTVTNVRGSDTKIVTGAITATGTTPPVHFDEEFDFLDPDFFHGHTEDLEDE